MPQTVIKTAAPTMAPISCPMVIPRLALEETVAVAAVVAVMTEDVAVGDKSVAGDPNVDVGETG